MNKRIVVGLTGASGIIYGVRLVEELLKAGCTVDLVCSEAANLVYEDEIGPLNGVPLQEHLRHVYKSPALNVYDNSQMCSPIASGSCRVTAMVVVPCSMSTVSAIASGAANSLLKRAADVMLKERRPLILVPRETPFSLIHLRNLVTLAEAGATVLPAMPAFYHHPASIDDMIDFVVGKIMDQLGVEHDLFKRYDPNATA